MSYTYSALILYRNVNGRFANLTQAPTVTALDMAGNAIPGATITNLAVGVYKVLVIQDELEDVLFRVVPHVDDQTNFYDVAVMQEKVYHVADEILTDTGTTLPAAIAGISTWVAINIGAGVTSSSITQIRGNTWYINITDITLDANKQQFAIKSTNLDTDNEAILLVDSVTGLLRFNGEAAANASKASMSYVGTTLTITVDAEITAQLPMGRYCYGIQSVTATGIVAENYGGSFIIAADTIRATT